MACFFSFLFLFVKRASPPGLELAAMAQVITVDPNPMDEGTSGDDTFYPAVMGLCVVVKSTFILGVWSLVLLSCGKGCIPL